MQAHLHSAYKPLVFYFIEDIDASLLAEVTIHYPVHPQASPQRFLQEAYPLAALLARHSLSLPFHLMSLLPACACSRCGALCAAAPRATIARIFRVIT